MFISLQTCKLSSNPTLDDKSICKKNRLTTAKIPPWHWPASLLLCWAATAAKLLACVTGGGGGGWVPDDGEQLFGVVKEAGLFVVELVVVLLLLIDKKWRLRLWTVQHNVHNRTCPTEMHHITDDLLILTVRAELTCSWEHCWWNCSPGRPSAWRPSSEGAVLPVASPRWSCHWNGCEAAGVGRWTAAARGAGMT